LRLLLWWRLLLRLLSLGSGGVALTGFTVPGAGGYFGITIAGLRLALRTGTAAAAATAAPA
jgi:hypothetical protein